jgi:hypothetical protein
MSYGDTTQDAGIGIYGDVVFYDRMTGNIEHIALGIILEAF